MISFEVGKGDVSGFVLLAQCCFGSLEFFVVPFKF